MYKQFKDKADFRVVYIREVRAGKVRVAGEEDDVPQPKTLAERESICRKCADRLKLTIPMTIDGMDDAVDKAYGGWPARIYVVGKDGKVAYQSDPGAQGFKPKDAEKALKEILGVRS